MFTHYNISFFFHLKLIYFLVKTIISCSFSILKQIVLHLHKDIIKEYFLEANHVINNIKVSFNFLK